MIDALTMSRIKKCVSKYGKYLSREDKQDCYQGVLLRILEGDTRVNYRWLIMDWMSENGLSTWRMGKRSAVALGSQRFSGELSDVQERHYEITDDLHSIDLKNIISQQSPRHQFFLKALARDIRPVEIARELEVHESRVGQLIKESITAAQRRSR